MGSNPDQAAQRNAIMTELDQHFRPEFLNRLDETIIFHSLSRQDILRIVELQLKKLEAMLDNRHISVDISSRAKQLLGDLGWDPVFGARPPTTCHSKAAARSPGVALLEGVVSDGVHIRVDVDENGNELAFHVAEGEAVLA